MENTLPCAHIPPLISAGSTVSPSIIERCGLYQRRSNSTKDVGVSNDSSSNKDAGGMVNEGGVQDNPNTEQLCSLLQHPHIQTDGVNQTTNLDSSNKPHNSNASFDTGENSSAGTELKGDQKSFHNTRPVHHLPPTTSTEIPCNGGSNSGTFSAESLPPLTSNGEECENTTPMLPTIQSVSASNNKNSETGVNNLQAARPKERGGDHNHSNHYNHPRYHNQHQQQVNIPIGNHNSTSDNTQNSLSSVIQKDSSSPMKQQQPRLSKSPMSKNDTVSTTTTTAAPTTTTTTTMPYSNCTLFKQGPLVQGNGPINGNMPCSSKCYALQQSNGLVITPDFKTMSITKMSHLQHVDNHNQKKHSPVAELVNYENSHEVANTTKSDLLLQSNLNNAKHQQQQQQQHTCKSLKYENNSNVMNATSVAAVAAVSSCINCNNSTNTSTTTGGKIVSKKCKALYNLQCKFQKNRFISSLQDCCRACNSFEGCCGSTESLELETGLLCPSYSYCDSENVVHYNKDNTYKSQIGACVEESPAPGSGNIGTNSNNLRSNDLGSSGVAAVDNREEDFGDFIEADFPPVQSSHLMSSSTDSTESASSLTSSDINETSNQQMVVCMNDIITAIHDRTNSNGVHFTNSNYFKNCDHKKHNQLSFPSTSTGTYNNTKYAKNTYVSFSEFGDSNSMRREQDCSVIKCADVPKVSSSLLSSSSLSSQSPASSPSSSPSPSSATSPPSFFLYTGDQQLQNNHKRPDRVLGCSGISHDHHAGCSSGVRGPHCHNNTSTAMRLPLTGSTANSCRPTPDYFMISPDVDFLDFDIVSTTTPNMDSEQNVNSAGGSAGAIGFDSLCEIPYADDVDSACPSPSEDMLPTTISNGSVTPKPLLANCATNDLSASSSNSNLSARSGLEDPMLPHGHSNFQNRHNMTQKCFSNLNLDDQDDVSIDSEGSGSHDSNEIGEADDHHHLGSLLHPRNGLQNNFLSSPGSQTSSDDIDLRDTPGPQEPIYEDIDGVHLDNCTVNSPGDKCCCTSPSDTAHKSDIQALNMQHTTKKKHSSKSRRSSVERLMIWDENQAYNRQVNQTESEVSACGPIAVLNMLNAFNILVEKSKVLEKAPVNLRDSTAPIPQYLFSRAKAGTTARVLIDFVESITNGAIKGRFFDFYPPRDVQVLKWLGEWLKKDAIPLATLNIQKAVQPGWAIPDSWHHQMIYGVSPKGVYMTNPLMLVSEEHLMQQLTSDRVLLVRRQDIVSRFHDDTNLAHLMSHEEAHRWRTMNVLGQVVNVLREASMPRVPGYRPQVTQHIRIPAAYRAGIAIFVRADMEAYQDLINAPNLPLKVDLSRELTPHGGEGGKGRGHISGNRGKCKVDGCDGDGNNSRDYNSSEGPISVTPILALPSPPVTNTTAASIATPPNTQIHDYAGRPRYFPSHGYPHRNNVYIHYFNS